MTTFWRVGDDRIVVNRKELKVFANRNLSEWKDMGADRHLAETLRKRLMANVNGKIRMYKKGKIKMYSFS